MLFNIVSQVRRYLGLSLLILTQAASLAVGEPPSDGTATNPPPLTVARAARPLPAETAQPPTALPDEQHKRDLFWSFVVFIVLQMTAILALILNTIRRVRSERALAESEARNRSIIRALPDLVCITDAAGICQEAYAAPATAAPATLRQMRGRGLAEALGVPDHADLGEIVARTLSEMAPQVFECRTTQSPARDYSARTAPLIVPGTHDSRVLIALRDITDAKQIARERSHLERREQHDQKLESLGMMAGGIAHDFNNLLMGISGHAELGLKEPALDARLRTYLEAILNAARNAASLSLKMLAYSGRQFASHVDIDLRELLQESRGDIDQRLPAKARVTVNCHDDSLTVRGNADLLKQALLSIIDNAAEAIGDAAGTISVEAKPATLTSQELASGYLSESPPPGDYVALKIHDNGSGIDPANLGRIFDPFFSTKFTGRGLGLAAVLGIVRCHHGTVQVESSPFDGTTISLLLPCAHHERHTPTPSEPAPHVADFKGSRTILLADDEEAVRVIGTRMLRKQGYLSVTVQDGQEAIESLTADPKRYCAAILDVTMPRKDGLTTYREMHALVPDLPIIMASGYSEDQIMDRFDEHDSPPFLHKPFRLSELSDVLAATISDA